MSKKQTKCEHYDEVIKILSYYNLIKGHVEFLNASLEEIDYNDGIDGVQYDKTFTSKTNKIVQMVEDTAIRNMEYGDVLLRQIRLYTHKLDVIENCLEKLTSIQRQIIVMRYFNNESWNAICDALLYSRAACYKHHEQAITQLDVLFYGMGSWWPHSDEPRFQRVNNE